MRHNKPHAAQASAQYRAAAVAAGYSFKEEPDPLASAADVKGLATIVGKAIKELRAGHESLAADMKTRGAADVVSLEAVRKLEENFANAQKSLDQVQLQLKRIPTTFDGSVDPAETKKLLKFWEAKHVQGGGRIADAPVEITQEMLDAHKAYRPAFANLLRKGVDRDRMSPDELKSLVVGVDPSGGYFVPATMGADIVQKVFETSNVRPLAGSITIGTDAFEYPKDIITSVSGGWVGEMAARATTATPTLGMARIPVYEQYAYPEISQKMLEDSVIDIEGWLTGKTTDVIVRTENTAFVTGNGINKPRGFMDYSAAAVTTEDATRAWGVLQYLGTGVSGGFKADPDGPDTFIDVMNKLQATYRAAAKWMMGRLTMAAVLKMQDSNGDYHFMTPGSMAQGLPTGILGHGVEFLEDMPAQGAGLFPVAFGELKRGYLIVDRLGISVLRNPFSNIPMVGFYTRKRVGGDVVDSQAIKLIKQT